MQKCPGYPRGFLMQVLEWLPQSWLIHREPIRNLRRWTGLSDPLDLCRTDSPVSIAQRRNRTGSKEAERQKRSLVDSTAVQIQSSLCRTTPCSFGRRESNQTALFLSMSSINAKARGECINEAGTTT